MNFGKNNVFFYSFYECIADSTCHIWVAAGELLVVVRVNIEVVDQIPGYICTEEISFYCTRSKIITKYPDHVVCRCSLSYEVKEA